jgi:hypothetical protein
MSNAVLSLLEPGEIVGQVLLSEMELNPGQVMFTNNKFEIPTVGLYIVISYVGPGKIISNVNQWQDAGAAGLNEVQSLTMLQMLQIDILGYSTDPTDQANNPRLRKEEIAMALRSAFSQGMQEQYQMQIARQPGPFLDTSFLEETKMITRYTTTIVTTSVYQKTKTQPFFNAFETKVYDDLQAPPIADFEAQTEPAIERVA